DALNTVSGVEAVSSDRGSAPPITLFERVRRAATPGDELRADLAGVGPRYFETLGIPIERGRDLADADFLPGRDSTVIVVNQTFARLYFPVTDPLDQRLVLPGNSETGRPARTVQIVGVAHDNKATAPNSDSIPIVYTPQLSTSLLIRVEGSPIGWLRGLE